MRINPAVKQLVSIIAPVFLPVFLFFIQVVPYWGMYPLLDGMVKNDQAYVIAKYGLLGYLHAYHSVSPPFQIGLMALLYNIFHTSIISSNFPAALFGIIAIIFYYALIHKIAGRTPAFWSALLLAINPLFLSNSINFIDFTFITELLIVASYAIYTDNNILYMLAASAALLSKEPAALFPVASIIGFTIFACRMKLGIKRLWMQTAVYFSPLLFYVGWTVLLKIYGKPATWHEWIFIKDPNQNVYVLIIKDILTFDIFNGYTLQNFYHLLLFNFNWIYSLAILIFFLSAVKKMNYQKVKDVLFVVTGNRLAPVLCVFILLYAITILTFPTWAIPRYILPILPVMIFLAVRSMMQFSRYTYTTMLFVITGITVYSTYFSIDPIVLLISGTTDILGPRTYVMNQNNGVDGYVYNLQFAQVIQYNNTLTQVVTQHHIHYLYYPQTLWYIVAYGIKENEQFDYLSKYTDYPVKGVTVNYLTQAVKGNQANILIVSQTPLRTVVMNKSIVNVHAVGNFRFSSTNEIFFYMLI